FKSLPQVVGVPMRSEYVFETRFVLRWWHLRVSHGAEHQGAQDQGQTESRSHPHLAVQLSEESRIWLNRGSAVSGPRFREAAWWEGNHFGSSSADKALPAC